MALWAVTGGSGFVGVHLVRRLLGEGHAVRSLDVAPLDRELADAGAEGTLGDVRDAAAAAALCAGADVLVHAAASLPSRGSAEEIGSVNVQGTATVLAAAAEARVRRAVFLSSAVVYGLPASVPVGEGAWTAPLDAYGRSKVEAERVCRELWLRGLETVVLRPTAVVGAERAGVFGLLFDWVAEGRRIYTLGPGTNRYQLLAVSDLVEAVLAAAELPVAGQVYNLGATELGTVAEDLAALIAHAGSQSRVVSLPAGASRLALRGLAAARLSPLAEWHFRTADRDVELDVSKAERELGWRPRLSNPGALAEAYDWYVAHRAGLRAGETHRSTWGGRALGLLRRLS